MILTDGSERLFLWWPVHLASGRWLWLRWVVRKKRRYISLSSAFDVDEIWDYWSAE